MRNSLSFLKDLLYTIQTPWTGNLQAMLVILSANPPKLLELAWQAWHDHPLIHEGSSPTCSLDFCYSKYYQMHRQQSMSSCIMA